MAPLCLLRLPHWQQRPSIWSNTLRTCLWMAPRPSWLKRAQHLEGRRRVRRPTQVGARDRKVTRAPDLCIGMSAGMMRVATMVEARSNSPRADRPLHLHSARSAQNKVLQAGSCIDVQRRRCVKPRLCEHRPSSPSTCAKRRHAIRTPAHTGSIDVCHPMGPVYGKGLWRSLQATVSASSVERRVPRARNLSSLSVPGPRWRGTRLRRSTGASGKRARSY